MTDPNLNCEDSYFGYRKIAYALQRERDELKSQCDYLKDSVYRLEETLSIITKTPKGGIYNNIVLRSLDGLTAVVYHPTPQLEYITHTPMKIHRAESNDTTMPDGTGTIERRYRHNGRGCGSLRLYEEVQE